jgi:hypothetical protein
MLFQPPSQFYNSPIHNSQYRIFIKLFQFLYCEIIDFMSIDERCCVVEYFRVWKFSERKTDAKGQ